MTNKYINQPHNTTATPHNAEGSFWHEMKPFVKFGFKALGIMAGALIAIVKAIPRPTDSKAVTGTNVINIDKHQ